MELWGCRAAGGCCPPQHSTVVLRKEKRDLATDSGLWETPSSYPALAPSLTFSGSTISTFPALRSCPAAPSEPYKHQNCPCKVFKTCLSPSLSFVQRLPDDEGKPNPWASHGQEALIKSPVLLMNNYSLLPALPRSQAEPRTVVQAAANTLSQHLPGFVTGSTWPGQLLGSPEHRRLKHSSPLPVL